MEELKKNIVRKITGHFADATVKEYAGNRVDFTVKKETIPAILFYLKDEMGYNHLSHISCVDWLEEKEFELIFILWSYSDHIKVFVRTRVDGCGGCRLGCAPFQTNRAGWAVSRAGGASPGESR